jgi:hypothetical protein
MHLNLTVCKFHRYSWTLTYIFIYKGAYAVGTINDAERFDVVRHACPGPGACGGEQPSLVAYKKVDFPDITRDVHVCWLHFQRSCISTASVQTP